MEPLMIALAVPVLDTVTSATACNVPLERWYQQALPSSGAVTSPRGDDRIDPLEDVRVSRTA